MMSAAATQSLAFSSITMKYVDKGHVVEALRDVDLELEPGQFLSLVGPSGCGKSTLLKIAAGLVGPSAGVVKQDGRLVNPVPNVAVGYIPQQDSLLPWRTAVGNVEFPLECRGFGRAERRERALSVLETVGLSDFAHAYPRQLSGGMRKRVSIARTLSYDPTVLLADEPFGALDAQLKAVMGAEFQRIWMEIGSTVLFVTHDLWEAIALSDRVVVLSSRPGQIVADRHIDLPRPRDVLRLHFDAAVADLHAELWNLLEKDAARGQEM